jgi:hypothetical protein
MDNREKIKLEHTLDQMKAAHEPMLQQLIYQVEEIDNALNELYNNYSRKEPDEIKIVVEGKEYPLGLWHTDVVHIVGCMLKNIISFAKDEMQ